MNISKLEQRVLHVLAQGGEIHFIRATSGKIADVTCFNRNGHVLSDCTPALVDRLKKRHFILSRGGRPYRITHAGIRAVRSQLDNR